MQWRCGFFAPKNWNLTLARHGMSGGSGRTRQFAKVFQVQLACQNLVCCEKIVNCSVFLSCLLEGDRRRREICALSWRPWYALNQRTVAILINARITNWFVFVSATSILPKTNECSSRPHHTKLSRCLSICTRFMNFFGRVLLCQLTKFVHQARCAPTCPKEHVGKKQFGCASGPCPRVPMYAVRTTVVL